MKPFLPSSSAAVLILMVSCALLATKAPSRAAQQTLPLAGTWRLELDRADAGVREKWFGRSLPDHVRLPGSLPAQGIGDDVSVGTRWMGGIVDKSWLTAPEYARYRQPGNLKVPFWLQPEKYYAGVAWYQRDIEIPAGWKDQRVVLTLERPHWETQVWLDDLAVGTNNSLSTPHAYDLGTGLRPGKHRLTIRVDNRMVVDVGENSHSVSDHTQGNWNGIVGNISLRSTPPVWVEDLQIYPRISDRRVRVKGKLGNATGREGQGQLVLLCEPARGSGKGRLRQELPVSWTGDGGVFEAELDLGPDAATWDEFNPALYALEATLMGFAKRTTFGLREISTQGTRFLVNGRRTFFRGTLECCIFPKTGHPPVDVESWKRVIRTAQAYGLNLIRFHSWCPPEAAFVAADELGFYYQVEVASWCPSLGEGKPVDEWLYQEAARILKEYGNHPSFMLMPYGNEPGGPRHRQYLARWVDHWKAADPRRLFTSGAGWPELPENQFHVLPEPRIQAWGAGLKSRINAFPPETRTDYRAFIQARSVPLISHEIGQWCVYPNFDEIPKYTGYLKPRNFEIFRDSLEDHHLGASARRFLLASGKLQTLCYKEDIESALRTPGMGGFQLLDLHDFPGQGTALVGVLDPFWEDKGYVTAREFSRFCNRTVPLARLGKRVFTTDEELEAELEVAHFGAAPIENAAVVWQLVADNQQVVGRGELPPCAIPVDNGVRLGSLKLALARVPAPARYKLVVRLGTGRAEVQAENDWDIWVYPARVEPQPPAGVLVTTDPDEAVAALRSGAKVLLTLPPDRVRNDARAPVIPGFSSIFWNTAWTSRQPPTTLGILCNPKHPALAGFPTDYHSNWQWWYVVHQAAAMILDDLPAQLRPVVQVIDDWVTNRKLAIVLEAKVGPGQLLVCSLDLTRGLEQNPVARQLRRSLLDYAASARFRPATSLTPEQVRSLVAEPSTAGKHGARAIRADSVESGFAAGNAIDGNPASMWHTAWKDTPAPFPHEIVIGFDRPARLRGFRALPRQDGLRNGWVKDYELYLSADGQHWGSPVAKGAFPDGPAWQQVTWANPVEARFVRLVAVSGHADGPWASLAEFDIIEDPRPGQAAP